MASRTDSRRRQRRLLPVWSCSGWGLPSQPSHPGCWCALTAPFHPYLWSPQRPIGGLFSAALSLTSRPVGVADHPVLRSPDFPLARNRPLGDPSQRPSGPLRSQQPYYLKPVSDYSRLTAEHTFWLAVGARFRGCWSNCLRKSSDFHLVPVAENADITKRVRRHLDAHHSRQ